MNSRCIRQLSFILIIVFLGSLSGCHSKRNILNHDKTPLHFMQEKPAAPNMVLTYYGYDKNGSRDWTPEILKYYLSYIPQDSKEGKPADLLFDTVLWMYRKSSRGHLFESSPSYNPTTLIDWRECLDRLYIPGQQLNALEETAKQIENQLDRPVVVQVILMLPYPDVRNTDWSEGQFEPAWDFTQSDDIRLKAIEWYVNQAIDRWNGARFQHLQLLGFYWMHESHTNMRKDSATVSDIPLMQATAQLLHNRKVQGRPLTLSWIPYNPYGKSRLSVVETLLQAPEQQRIDYLMIQPNYFFARWDKKQEDMDQIYSNAAKVGSGIEIEFDERISEDPNLQKRFEEYLDSAASSGVFEREVPVGYYQGVRGIYSIATMPEQASYYDQLYQFVRKRKKQAGQTRSTQ